MRTTTEIIDDHLKLRFQNSLDEDLARNYSHSVRLLTENSNEVGWEAIRTSAQRLSEQAPNAQFDIISRKVNGPFALLIWRASSPKNDIIDGADSFVVHDGKIVFQSIHYRLTEAE